MDGDLRNFFETFFTRHGALVEPVDGGAIEILSPKDLAEQISISELERFYFSDSAASSAASAAPIAGRRVTYDSDVLESLGKTIERYGLITAASLTSLPLKKLDVERDIDKAVSLQNAVLKVHGEEQTWISFMIFNFKYSAFSDERREGLVSLAVNESTLNSVPGLVDALWQFSLESERPAATFERKSFPDVYGRGRRVAQSLIRDAMADFVKSMNRRLNRDVTRVVEYYGALRQEMESRIKKKKLAGEELERELSRMRATELERERKIRDVQEKYNLSIKVEPINLMRLFLPATVVRLKLLRRKWVVNASVAWNPVTRELERLTCLSCYRPSKGIYICDDRLHTVCADCFPLCPSCGRHYCAACYTNGCPKCKDEG